MSSQDSPPCYWYARCPHCGILNRLLQPSPNSQSCTTLYLCGGFIHKEAGRYVYNMEINPKRLDADLYRPFGCASLIEWTSIPRSTKVVRTSTLFSK